MLNLATVVPGGLRPTKLGGGFNSTSLSLVDTAGQPYVLRTVDKDPARAMPPSSARHFSGQLPARQRFGHPPLRGPGGAAAGRSRGRGPHHAAPLLRAAPMRPQLAGDSLGKLRGQLVMLEEKCYNGRAARPCPARTRRWWTAAEMFPRSVRQRRSNLSMPRPCSAPACSMPGWATGTATPASGPGPKVPARRRRHAPFRPVPKDRDMVFYRPTTG